MNRILLFIFALFLPTLSDAQISQKAKEAVRNIENKVKEKAVEKAFNSLTDKLFGKDSTQVKSDTTSSSIDSTQQNATESILGGLFSSSGKVDKMYSFHVSLGMKTITRDKKGEEYENAFVMHYPKKGAYVASELQNAINIMDFEDMKNYTITGGNMTVLNLQNIIDKAKESAEEESATEEVFKPIKTGNTKKILGFNCDEYVLETNEMRVDYWITKDIEIDQYSYLKAFETQKIKYSEFEYAGVIMSMISKHLQDETVTITEVTSINKEEITYDLSKYKTTNLSKFKF